MSSAHEVLMRHQDEAYGYFMDLRVKDMTREELIGLIGWMCKDKQTTVAMRDDHIKMLKGLYAYR